MCLTFPLLLKVELQLRHVRRVFRSSCQPIDWCGSGSLPNLWQCRPWVIWQNTDGEEDVRVLCSASTWWSLWIEQILGRYSTDVTPPRQAWPASMKMIGLRTFSVIEGELQCSSRRRVYILFSSFVKTVFQSAGWRIFNPSMTTLSSHPLRSRLADFGEHQHNHRLQQNRRRTWPS